MTAWPPVGTRHARQVTKEKMVRNIEGRGHAAPCRHASLAARSTAPARTIAEYICSSTTERGSTFPWERSPDPGPVACAAEQQRPRAVLCSLRSLAGLYRSISPRPQTGTKVRCRWCPSGGRGLLERTSVKLRADCADGNAVRRGCSPSLGRPHRSDACLPWPCIRRADRGRGARARGGLAAT